MTGQPGTRPEPHRASRRPRPWWVACVCGFAFLIDAAATAILGLVVLVWQAELGLSPLDVGLLTSVLTFGLAVGALVGGRLGDRLGRRRVFIATMATIAAGALLLLASPEMGMLVAGSALIGLGAGADAPVAASTIAEVARDQRQRGRMFGFTGILTAVGGISAGIAGSVVGDQGMEAARLLLIPLAALALIGLALRFTVPESEQWQRAQDERRAGVQTVRAENSEVRDLFRPPYRSPFLALLGFLGLAAVTSTVINYGSYMLVNHGGLSIAEAAALNIAIIPAAFGVVILLMFVLPSKRRFRWFIGGVVIQVIAPLIPLVLGFTSITYLAMVIPMILATGLAGPPIAQLWAQEQFPTLIRNTASGATTSAQKFVIAGTSLFVPLVIASSLNLMLALTSVAMLAGGAWAWAVFRERDQRPIFSVEDDLDEASVSGTPAPTTATG